MENQVLTKHHGGAEGNRTPDLLIANEALSQLSYSPMALLIVPIGPVSVKQSG